MEKTNFGIKKFLEYFFSDIFYAILIRFRLIPIAYFNSTCSYDLNDIRYLAIQSYLEF